MAQTKKKSSSQKRAVPEFSTDEINYTAGITFLLLGGILTALALFESKAIVWQALRQLLFGIFGSVSYVIGLGICYFAITGSHGKLVAPKLARAALGVLLLCSTLITLSAPLPIGVPFFSVLKTCYTDGLTHPLGGGLLGVPVGQLLLFITGRRSLAVLVMLLLDFAGGMIISDTTTEDLYHFLLRAAAFSEKKWGELRLSLQEYRVQRRHEKEAALWDAQQKACTEYVDDAPPKETPKADTPSPLNYDVTAISFPHKKTPNWMNKLNLSQAPQKQTTNPPPAPQAATRRASFDIELDDILTPVSTASQETPTEVSSSAPEKKKEVSVPPTPAELERAAFAEWWNASFGYTSQPTEETEAESTTDAKPTASPFAFVSPDNVPSTISTSSDTPSDPISSAISVTPTVVLDEPSSVQVLSPSPIQRENVTAIASSPSRTDSLLCHSQPDEDGWVSLSDEPFEAAQPLVPPSPESIASVQEEEISVRSDIQQLAAAAMAKPAVSEQQAAQHTNAEEGAAPIDNSYQYPSIQLFEETETVHDQDNAKQELQSIGQKLVDTLDSFGVKTSILDISRGPAVTRYEIQPMAGVKVSRITALTDDIALNLAVAGIRMEAPIPGKPAVGIEVPNAKRQTVSIRSIFESKIYKESKSPCTIVLGKDIAGVAQVSDLCKMPHLLIAGSTGSGKSVCVNSIIMSLLFRSSPEEVRLLLIDPKFVELAEYNGIPHLLMPVVTDPKKAAGALGSAVVEMEKRYQTFAQHNVRDIRTYNKFVHDHPDLALTPMPYIVIIVDELADLMMVAGKDIEDSICRIAQKARAAGMHLIVATQRPSVDVITGLIKANIPSRIAFAVSSGVDSRTILDGYGAEKLLGMGDMLFMPVGAPKPTRIQGCFVRDEEISRVLDFIKKSSSVQYDEEMIALMERHLTQEKGKSETDEGEEDGDPLFPQAVEVVIDAGQASTSLLQRRCKLGYARAARIIDEMEQKGIIGPPEGSKPRAVLISRQDWLEMNMNS